MPVYHITYQIDVEAESPVDAAVLAASYMLNPGMGPILDVTDNDGVTTRVDTDYDPPMAYVIPTV